MVRPVHIPHGKTRPRQFSADKGGTYAYGYDSAYRLTSESRTGFRSYSASHTYDAMGNRLTRTLDGVTRSYSYNDADQVTGWTEGTKVGSYTYDVDGSVTQKLVTDGGTPTDQWDYEFDSVGRMVNGAQSVGGTQSTANVYAGDQWYRVSSTTIGTTLKYGWRRGELFAESDSGGQLSAGYLNDDVDQPFYKTRFSSDGTMVDGRDFYQGDDNLRIHHVTDASGNVAEKYVYNAYGRRTILDASNNPLTSSAIGNRIGFQGREHEGLSGPGQEAGLTFHRNRFYDPDVGKWERRDPIGYLGGINQYGFVGSGPVSSLDPWGMERYLKNCVSDSLRVNFDPGPHESNWQTLMIIAGFLPLKAKLKTQPFLRFEGEGKRCCCNRQGEKIRLGNGTTSGGVRIVMNLAIHYGNENIGIYGGGVLILNGSIAGKAGYSIDCCKKTISMRASISGSISGEGGFEGGAYFTVRKWRISGVSRATIGAEGKFAGELECDAERCTFGGRASADVFARLVFFAQAQIGWWSVRYSRKYESRSGVSFPFKFSFPSPLAGELEGCN